ncbi:hypothetical protein SAMN05192574_112123 [Mucilaginibacter gossypiicola]|uniref:Uncharacterized protein n=1 Tax=Mucilaginibacter gossypiicola TaxID=551995 RepID=A0A1H8SE62_9SPHI|nr:hypothetical protein [Mucilaginibacter gossypiicola]SEO76952.1 hypothetical protein SAMN05192574_112123 [Mucilaginibacter gossypiicola]
MSKAKTLKALSVITFLEIIAMVAWPVILGWGQLIGPAGKLLFTIFILPFFYYIGFLIFLSRYAKREKDDQNIGLIIFSNIIPIIGLLYVLDIF